MQTQTHWIDRLTSPIAPRWTLKRQRARLAADLLLARHYEGAAVGRRTQGWRQTSTDANRAIGPASGPLRNRVRDLVRNNPYAESALSIIVDHTVGYGISAKMTTPSTKAETIWKAWAESTDCDADGRHDFAGLQKLVLRTVAESGECLVRRRLRFATDGLSIPLQLQVLEPDFLDTSKDLQTLPNGGRIIQGVEFDPIGNRVGYWIFDEHPGSGFTGGLQSRRIDAAQILHVFDAQRPGQVRGVSWFAPVLVLFKDFDELADATLMKQKVAACLAVITSDIDGTAAPVGEGQDTKTPGIDALEPGMVLNLPAGRSVSVVQPPTVREYGEYSQTILHALAAGLGVTYEDLTSDFSNVNFSSSRMARMKHQAHVNDWRWRMLVPQFCDPAFAWAMEVAAVFGSGEVPSVQWTAPPLPMIDPVNEGLAYQRNIRSSLMTLSEALRERGYDPSAVLSEIKTDNDLLDKLGIVSDSDPRKTTQAGQLQGDAAAMAADQTPARALEETARRLRVVERLG